MNEEFKTMKGTKIRPPPTGRCTTNNVIRTQKGSKPMPPPSKDIINYPEHYTKGIEVIDYIMSKEFDFLEGNVIKYVSRYKYKNGLEDLKKARFYLEKLIKRMEK